MEQDLYEKTENRGIIYNPLWAMSFSYQGDTTDVSWCHLSTVDTSNEYTDYGLRIRVNGDSVDLDDNWRAYNAAKALRIPEVREMLLSEINPNGLMSYFSSREDIAAAIKLIFAKVSAGEFLGQSRGTIIYVQNVAEILDFSVSIVLDVINDILIPRKEIGLNGMILSTWESQEEGRLSWEKHTGHKDLTVSDFGSWRCHYCGKHGDGDDRERPKDVTCEITNDDKTEEVV